MILLYFNNQFTVTGPYLNKKQGRRFVTLTNITTKKRTQKTYAKYLMENHLGRTLSKNETVDHIDGDKLNDIIENFQILTQSEHTRKDILIDPPIKIKCVWCKNTIIKKAGRLRNQRKSGYAGPFCSAQCRGQYGAYILHGGKKFPLQPNIKSEYCYIEDIDE